jgi:hypothetical protein
MATENDYAPTDSTEVQHGGVWSYISHFARRIIYAPAPQWMVRMNLRMASRRIHKCADHMLAIGDEESYKTAVELRALAHRVSDSAN